MNRRDFVTCVGAGFAVSAINSARNSDGKALQEPEGMKLGCQSGSSERHLRFFKRHGVNHICGRPDNPVNGRMWTYEELASFKGRVEGHGISLDMIEPPFLASTHVDKTERAAIVLGQNPERDRDIEDILSLIRTCARLGIPAIKYNLNLLGVLRTNPVEGRGGIRESAWRLSEASERAQRMTRAGRVTADTFWERIEYFLDRVIPAAEEYKIRMACHPHDPNVPPGFEGVDCVLGTVSGLKKFIALKESPYHGLNFCQGTVCEMLENPAREVAEVIRYFGSRKKIFNVHFRNIRGGRNDFVETFPDDGEVNMVKALRAYREVGYSHMIMPDHVPLHPEDPGRFQAFAFCYGYIRALLQAAEA